MKKIYITPEMEILWCEMPEDVLMESYESIIPSSSVSSETPTGDPMEEF